MANNSTTLSIKTTPAIKAQIQAAADELGLSVNSFVIMVAKNAVDRGEITVRTRKINEETLLDSAEAYNAAHKADMSWDELKASYGV